jgi:peptidoglycan/xylan/chitin deacetylase (PgdA/CDA1 family)
MKAIISHDVDHITVWEHNKDLIIPKFLVRSSIELIRKSISVKEYLRRLNDILNNKWQNLEELMIFDKENSVKSTFFVGVSNGLGLSYSLKNAQYWIKNILKEGFDVGVHGIAYNDFDDMKKEYDLFKQISGQEKIGIRMHYLRSDKTTLELLSKTGYYFDSTLYELDNPFKIGDLWELPLCLMDGYIINKNSRYQNQNLKQVKDTTKEIIEEAFRKNLKYFTVLFHDRYFSDSFWTWKEWYIWLIEYLRENKIEFISFKEAVEEMENA